MPNAISDAAPRARLAQRGDEAARAHVAARAPVGRRSRACRRSARAAPRRAESGWPGHVEAEHLLLVLEALPVGPRRRGDQRRLGRARRSALPNRFAWPISRSRCAAAPRLERDVERGPHRRRGSACSESNAPHLHQALDHAPVHAPAVDPRREVEQARGTARSRAPRGSPRSRPRRRSSRRRARSACPRARP